MRVGERKFAAQARVLTAESDAKVLDEIRTFSSRKYGWGEGTVVEIRPDKSRQESL